MGPECGDVGGEVVVQGTPEQILNNPRSHTAVYLRSALARRSAKKSRAAA